MSFGKTFEQQRKRFDAKLKRARGIAGNSAVRHFRDSFRNEGFTDDSLEKWKEVKRRIPDTLAYDLATSAARSRGILRGTGKMSKSIKVIKSTQYTVVIGVEGIPYAPYHNEGAKWSQRSLFGRPLKQPIQVEIPKRQFIGNSKKLELEISKQLGLAWAQS